jgi:disulfide oxidoreductase YuzD
MIMASLRSVEQVIQGFHVVTDIEALGHAGNREDFLHGLRWIKDDELTFDFMDVFEKVDDQADAGAVNEINAGEIHDEFVVAQVHGVLDARPELKDILRRKSAFDFNQVEKALLFFDDLDFPGFHGRVNIFPGGYFQQQKRKACLFPAATPGEEQGNFRPQR